MKQPQRSPPPSRGRSKTGVDVEVALVAEVGDLAPYSAVIIGSAVYNGRWLDEARQFLREHDGELARQPTSLFSSRAIFGSPRSHRLGWTREIDDVAAARRPCGQPEG